MPRLLALIGRIQQVSRTFLRSESSLDPWPPDLERRRMRKRGQGNGVGMVSKVGLVTEETGGLAGGDEQGRREEQCVTIATTPGKAAVDASVVVVGAGPTGLLLAAELVRRDIGVLLIDGHDAPLGWDRATIVHARSIEIFEALGLADQIVDRSVKIRGAEMRSGGTTLGVMDLGLADRRYGFDLGLSEDETESVLTTYLEGLGGVVTRAQLDWSR